MGRKKMISLLLCAVFCVLIMAGCGGNEEKPTESVVQTEVVEMKDVIATEETASDSNLIMVATAYGKLFYQEQWVEFMKVAQVTEGEQLVVNFAAEFNGRDYPLFTVEIGAGEGDPVGIITDADGVQRDVFLRVEENIEHTELSQDEQNRLYAMQEELNFVIENLK